MTLEENIDQQGIYQPTMFKYEFDGRGFVAHPDADISDALILLNIQYMNIQTLRNENEYLRELVLVMAGKNDK